MDYTQTVRNDLSGCDMYTYTTGYNRNVSGGKNETTTLFYKQTMARTINDCPQIFHFFDIFESRHVLGPTLIRISPLRREQVSGYMDRK